MSGSNKQLTAQDGHVLDSYLSHPEGQPIGAVVVLQEIFGVNAHIRSVADRFAEEGYLAVAPALFDRIERGVQLTYQGGDMQRAYGLYQKLAPETALLDIRAAFVEGKMAGRSVGVVGFCYGGFMSWLAATRGDALTMRPDCCVGYYPGGIGLVAGEEPNSPVLLHFGGRDEHIGAEQMEAVRSAHPELEIYTYPDAQHGFNCDARASFNPEAAALAQARTLAFLKMHLA